VQAAVKIIVMMVMVMVMVMVIVMVFIIVIYLEEVRRAGSGGVQIRPHTIRLRTRDTTPLIGHLTIQESESERTRYTSSHFYYQSATRTHTHTHTLMLQSSYPSAMTMVIGGSSSWSAPWNSTTARILFFSTCRKV
jgi:hypothetical protein